MRYDTKLKEEIGLDPTTMSLEEKIAATRDYRTRRYEMLLDAVYTRRGWTSNGVPTIETAQRLGIEKIDGVIELLQQHAE